MICKLKITLYIFSLLIVLMSSFMDVKAQEKGILSLSLNVINRSLPVNEAAVKFTSNGKEVELNVTQDNGRYTTVVPFGNEYLITIAKDNLVSKTVQVDSKIPEKYKKAFFYSKIAVELFSGYDKNADITALQEPYAFVKFDETSSNFEVQYNQKIKKEDHRAKETALVAAKKAASQESRVATPSVNQVADLPKQVITTDKVVAVVVPAEKEKTAVLVTDKKDEKSETLLPREEIAQVVSPTKKTVDSQLEQEEKAEAEKKRLKNENEVRNKKVKDAKAGGAEEEERQLKIKSEIDKKIQEDKNRNIVEQNRQKGLDQMKDQSSDEARERAQKEAAEKARQIELERLKAEALAKELSKKAQEEVRTREAEAARLAKLEDEKQALAKKRAKEEELAAKKAFELDLERKQKKLALEKDDKLKEKDIADLITECNTYPKGHTENFEGFKVFRIVKKRNEHSYILYKRTTYAFGEYFFENNRSITKGAFEKETHITD